MKLKSAYSTILAIPLAILSCYPAPAMQNTAGTKSPPIRIAAALIITRETPTSTTFSDGGSVTDIGDGVYRVVPGTGVDEGPTIPVVAEPTDERCVHEYYRNLLRMHRARFNQRVTIRACVQPVRQ